MKVVVDVFGGDNAPLEILKGAAAAEKELGVDILLSGDKEKIENCINENKIKFNNLEIIDAPDIMPMEAHPTTLLKEYKNSSMYAAFKALSDGQADAFVSAGSTGAIIVGGTFIVKRIKGVKRPALASLIPSPTGSYLLMDMGANAECRPEMLCQFGVLSSILLEKVYGRKNPTVGLLNIGTEETKGGELQQKAFELLSKAPINFVGNVESREMPKGVCDAIVTDGFTGNIALKLIEGTSITLFKMIKTVLYKNIFNVLAALVLKGDLTKLKKIMDSSEVGGALLIGVKAPVIKAHGNSDAKAFKNAIRQAKAYYDGKAIEQMSSAISAADDGTDNENS